MKHNQCLRCGHQFAVPFIDAKGRTYCPAQCGSVYWVWVNYNTQDWPVWADPKSLLFWQYKNMPPGAIKMMH